MAVENTEQNRMKGEITIRAMNIMNYDAANLGSAEGRYDTAYLKALASNATFPLLSASPPEGLKNVTQPYIIKDMNGIRVLIAGLSTAGAEKLSSAGGMDNMATAGRIAATARAAQALAVILFAGSRDEACELLHTVPGIDIIILGESDDFTTEAEKSGKAIIVSPGGRGKILGRLSLEWSPQAGITRYEGEIVSLGQEVKLHEDVNAEILSYNRRILEIFRERALSETVAGWGHSPYISADACYNCHEIEYDEWVQTPHSTAFNSLVRRERHYDPQCMKCHVTGFGESGGFIDAENSPHMKGVQCESCHGPGRDHVESADGDGMSPVDEGTCLRCHDHDRDPEFDYHEKISLIDHGSCRSELFR